MNKVYNSLNNGKPESASLLDIFKGIALIAGEIGMSRHDLEKLLVELVQMRVKDIQAVSEFLYDDVPMTLASQLIRGTPAEVDEVFDWARKNGHLRVCLLTDQLIRDILG